MRQHLHIGRLASTNLFPKRRRNLQAIGSQSHLTSQCLKGNETGTDAALVLPHLEHSNHQNTEMHLFATLKCWFVFFFLNLKIFTFLSGLRKSSFESPTSSPPPFLYTFLAIHKRSGMTRYTNYLVETNMSHRGFRILFW